MAAREHGTARDQDREVGEEDYLHATLADCLEALPGSRVFAFSARSTTRFDTPARPPGRRPAVRFSR